MVTTVGRDSKVEELLEGLIQLEYAAVAAYEDAVDRLHEAEPRATLGDFTEDHLRHIRELGGLLTEMGRTPPQKGDARRFLARGRVAIGGLLGDTAVLHAMRTNEDRTNAAYERAVQTAGLPAESRAVLERALGDERHHRDWIVSALKDM